MNVVGGECLDVVAARHPDSLTLPHLLVCCFAPGEMGFFVVVFSLGFSGPQRVSVHILTVPITVFRNRQIRKSLLEAAPLALYFFCQVTGFVVFQLPSRPLWCDCVGQEC